MSAQQDFINQLTSATGNSNPSATMTPSNQPMDPRVAFLSQLLSNVKNGVGQSAYDLSQPFVIPFQQIGNAIAPKYIPPVSDQQYSDAMQGSEMAMSPGFLDGGALTTGGIDTGVLTQGAKQAVKDTAGNVAQGAKDIAATAKAQPGGLQAGFVNPSAEIGAEARTVGNVAKNTSHIYEEPQNGGKYVNENTDPLKGGTPAKVKAATPSEAKFKYVAPTIDTETPNATATGTQFTNMPPISTTTPISEDSAILAQPTRPTQPNLSWNQKIAQKLNGLDNYQLPEKFGENRPNLEAQDKSVMQNVVGGNTADQVLNNANKAKATIWNQVETKAGAHSAISTNTQVLPYIKARLDNLVGEGTITQQQADTALMGEKSNLTQNGADITGDATITGNQLVDLRSGANKASPQKIPYGSTNPIPYIRKAIASGYSDAMGNLDPEINNLYQQYSSVKRIGQMPDSFRNQKLGGTIPLTHQGIPGISPLVGYGRRGAATVLKSNKATNALIGTGLVGTGVAGALGLPPIINSLNNKQTSDASQESGSLQDGKLSVHNGSSVSNNINNVNTPPTSPQQITYDKDGHVGIFNPYDGTNGITKGQYQSQLATKNAQLKDAQAAIGQDFGQPSKQQADEEAAKNIQTDIDTLNALNTKSRTLDAPYQLGLKDQAMANTATDDIKKGWSNISLANGSLNSLATMQDGKYSKLASALKALQDSSGISIFQPGMSLDVVLGNLQQATSTILYNDYYSNFPSQGGYTPTSSGMTTTPQAIGNGQTSQLPAPTPQGLPNLQNSGTGVAHPFQY